MLFLFACLESKISAFKYLTDHCHWRWINSWCLQDPNNLSGFPHSESRLAHLVGANPCPWPSVLKKTLRSKIGVCLQSVKHLQENMQAHHSLLSGDICLNDIKLCFQNVKPIRLIRPCTRITLPHRCLPFQPLWLCFKRFLVQGNFATWKQEIYSWSSGFKKLSLKSFILLFKITFYCASASEEFLFNTDLVTFGSLFIVKGSMRKEMLSSSSPSQASRKARNASAAQV